MGIHASLRCRDIKHRSLSCSPMPQPIRDYRDIIAWQRAQDLAVAVEEICEKLPRRSWRLIEQMKSAANSVYSNIAEGNGRFSVADYLRHLGISNASLNELESDLLFLERRYERPEIKKALELTVAVRRPLAGLVRSLRRKLKDAE